MDYANNHSTKKSVDQSVECNLVYDIGIECLNSLDPKTSKLCQDLNQALSDHMKKLVREVIHFDSKRKELFDILSQLDKDIDEKTRPKTGMFKFVGMNMNKDSFKLNNNELNQLASKFEQQMVDLSNIFLNEKIDLMFEHDKQVNELNQKIEQLKNELDSLKESKTSQTEANIKKEFDKETSTKILKLKTIDKETWTENEKSDSFCQTDSLDDIFDKNRSSVKEKIEKFENNFMVIDGPNIIFDSKDNKNEKLLSIVNNEESLNDNKKLRQEISKLIEENKNLNEIILELKRVIAKMFKKICENTKV